MNLDFRFEASFTMLWQGTVSSQKNEMLFSRFDINYNTLDLLFRRGSIILKKPISNPSANNVPEEKDDTSIRKPAKQKRPTELQVVHDDMLKDRWWTDFWEDQKGF